MTCGAGTASRSLLNDEARVLLAPPVIHDPGGIVRDVPALAVEQEAEVVDARLEDELQDPTVPSPAHRTRLPIGETARERDALGDPALDLEAHPAPAADRLGHLHDGERPGLPSARHAPAHPDARRDAARSAEDPIDRRLLHAGEGDDAGRDARGGGHAEVELVAERRAPVLRAEVEVRGPEPEMPGRAQRGEGPVRHAVDRIVDFDGRLEPGPAHGTAEDQAAPDRPEVALEVEDVGSRARSDRGAAEPPASTVDVAHGGDGEGSPGADDPGCEAERLGPV